MKILHEILLKYSNELSIYFSDADTIYCMLVFAVFALVMIAVSCLSCLCTLILMRKNKNIIGGEL